MIDLDITVLDVTADAFAATPTLMFRLGMTESSGEVVHAMALRCQIRIEPQRRQYSDDEQAALRDLFGPPDQWGISLKPFPWTQESITVSGFEGATVVEMPLRCTYDFEVVGSKYLHGLSDGHVPLLLLFSGTVFTRGLTGYSVEQVRWDIEARHLLPVSVWGDLVQRNFGGQGWLRASHDTLKALAAHKAARGLTDWNDVIGDLLARYDEGARA